jgi:toxin ParE1/3/4
MNVFWAETAIQHLSSIHSYVRQTSPAYAQRLIDRSQQFAMFPKSGRVVSEFGNERVREVIVDSYRMIYYLKSDEQIEVLAVLHGSQQIEADDDTTAPDMDGFR